VLALLRHFHIGMRLALFSIWGYAIILYADEWRMHGGDGMCLEVGV
jgi:hypothetical protein